MDRQHRLRVSIRENICLFFKGITPLLWGLAFIVSSINQELMAWERYSSANFVVTAESQQLAQLVAETAEGYRKQLAMEWLGKEMLTWAKPCTVQVTVGTMGAGGETTFSFCNGEVYGWKMHVRGSKERILDSVIPHEVTHTILACHFRCPLPRWADEGASTLIEHSSEKERQLEILRESLIGTRRIPLRKLFDIKDYPVQMRDVLTLYAEGYSVVDYLVERGGKRHFLAFLKEGMSGQWDQALVKYYMIQTTENLEADWQKWVIAGSPHHERQPETMLAVHREEKSKTQPQVPVIRGQNSETTLAKNDKQSSALTAAEPIKTSTETDWSKITLPDDPMRALDLRARPSRDRLELPVYTLRPVQNTRYEAGPAHYSSQAQQGHQLFNE